MYWNHLWLLLPFWKHKWLWPLSSHPRQKGLLRIYFLEQYFSRLVVGGEGGNKCCYPIFIRTSTLVISVKVKITFENDTKIRKAAHSVKNIICFSKKRTSWIPNGFYFCKDKLSGLWSWCRLFKTLSKFNAYLSISDYFVHLLGQCLINNSSEVQCAGK